MEFSFAADQNENTNSGAVAVCHHVLSKERCCFCTPSLISNDRRHMWGGIRRFRKRVGAGVVLLLMSSSYSWNYPLSCCSSVEAFHYGVQRTSNYVHKPNILRRPSEGINNNACTSSLISRSLGPWFHMASSSSDNGSSSSSNKSSHNSEKSKKRRQQQLKNKNKHFPSNPPHQNGSKIKKPFQHDTKSNNHSRSSVVTNVLETQQQQQQKQSKKSIEKATKKKEFNKTSHTSTSPTIEKISHLSVRDANNKVSSSPQKGFDPDVVATSNAGNTERPNQYKKRYMKEGDIQQILNDAQNDDGKSQERQRSSSKKIFAITTSEAASLSSSTSSSAGTTATSLRRNISVDRDGNLISSSRVRASVQETGSDTLNSYMKSMTNHALLRHEDEIVLANEIQIQVQWEEIRTELEEKLLRTPTHAEWAEELGLTVPKLKRQLRRSHKAKTAMMEANLRLVVTMARQTMKKQFSAGGNSVSFQDLCQEGMIGLSKACERYNPMKHQLGGGSAATAGDSDALSTTTTTVGSTGASGVVRFNTFAKWYIRRGILDSLATQSRMIRLPRSTMKRINTIRVAEVQLLGELGHKPSEEEVAQHLNISVEKVRFYKRSAEDAMSMDRQINTQTSGRKGSKASTGGAPSREEKELTLGQTLKDASNKTPTDMANQQMLRDDVRRMIMTLKPKEQAVVRMRFGLDDGIPQTHDDIATQFSVTKERIRKIESQALLKLRQPYRNQSVQCYKDDI